MNKHGTILLVEDDANDVLLMQKALTEAGVTHRVHTVHTGEQAVKYLSGHGKFADRANHPLPFLVLLDLKMPGEGGFAVLRWLFERPGLKKKFAVIVFSSVSQENEVQLAYELGAQSFIVKSSDYSELLATAQRLKEYWIDLNQFPTQVT